MDTSWKGNRRQAWKSCVQSLTANKLRLTWMQWKIVNSKSPETLKTTYYHVSSSHSLIWMREAFNRLFWFALPKSHRASALLLIHYVEQVSECHTSTPSRNPSWTPCAVLSLASQTCLAFLLQSSFHNTAIVSWTGKGSFLFIREIRPALITLMRASQVLSKNPSTMTFNLCHVNLGD